MSDSIQDNVIEWLKTQKGWQTELAYRILDHDIAGSDIDEIVTMLKAQATFVDKQFPVVMAGGGNTYLSLRLCEISGIRNIEGLAPKNPLVFSDGTNLSVVYGGNGSGKSSYTRIIKRLCGTPHAAKLKSNVFKSDAGQGACSVSFNLNGEKTTSQWESVDDAIPALSSIDVFDADVGRNYLQDENPSTYTPRIIALFDDLAKYYGEVARRLQNEKNALVSKLPTIPSEYSTTAAGKIYRTLSKDCTEESLQAILLFSASDLDKLTMLMSRLSETNPGQKAAEIRAHKQTIVRITDALIEALAKVNDASLKQFYSLKDDAIAKRNVANDALAVLQENSKLPSVGSPVWKELWMAAKKYSEEAVYHTETFPYLGEDSRCVLCHQKLDENAQKRFKAFDDYICGTIEYEATKAEKCFKEVLDNLPMIPANENIELMVSAAHLGTEWVEKLGECWAIIDDLKKRFTEAYRNVNSPNTDSTGEHKADDSVQIIISVLQQIANQYEQQATVYDGDAINFDRQKAKEEVNELAARKWCFDQRTAVLEEISRLKRVATYDSWILQCRTTPVTIKAGEIANTVITTEYLRRFNSELEKLHAGKLKVSISSSNNK